MGRPLKPIDGEQVFKLAQLGASYRQIAAVFGVDEKTIRTRFSAEKEQGEGCGDIAILRKQMHVALQGSVPMLTHLGMTRLGQRTKIDIEQVSTVTTVGPTPDLAAAIEAFGYVRPNRESVGQGEPSPLCNPGEPGGVADSGCSSSEAAE